VLPAPDRCHGHSHDAVSGQAASLEQQFGTCRLTKCGLCMQDNKSVLPKGKLEREFGDGVMFCTCE
jgi:hypothetical protein